MGTSAVTPPYSAATVVGAARRVTRKRKTDPAAGTPTLDNFFGKKAKGVRNLCRVQCTY